MNAPSSKVNVLGISGSLRKASFNTAALHAAQELAPPDVTITIHDISEIPLYNEDVEKKGFPAAVAALHAAIRGADAVLFATPEYNYSVAGVMKNTFDWASRPPTDCVLNGKPAAVFGASPGGMGTSRAQYHLRQSCVFANMLVLNKPEVFISQAHTKFDTQGKLTDEKTRAAVRSLIAALGDWTRRLRASA